MARVVVLALAVLAAASLAVQAASTCEPGFYAFNQSGLIVCLPPLKKIQTESVLISLLYYDTNISVSGFNRDKIFHHLHIDIYAPNGTRISVIDIDAQPEELFNKTININVSSSYVVANISIDGAQLSFYVVERLNASHGFSPTTLPSRTLQLLAGLIPIAPLVAASVRGDLRDAGIGLVAYSFFIAPWMIYWGMSVGSAVFLSGLVFVVGVFLALSGR